jgi:hypothetical protein
MRQVIRQVHATDQPGGVGYSIGARGENQDRRSRPVGYSGDCNYKKDKRLRAIGGHEHETAPETIGKSPGKHASEGQREKPECESYADGRRRSGALEHQPADQGEARVIGNPCEQKGTRRLQIAREFPASDAPCRPARQSDMPLPNARDDAEGRLA